MCVWLFMLAFEYYYSILQGLLPAGLHLLSPLPVAILDLLHLLLLPQPLPWLVLEWIPYHMGLYMFPRVLWLQGVMPFLQQLLEGLLSILLIWTYQAVITWDRPISSWDLASWWPASWAFSWPHGLLIDLRISMVFKVFEYMGYIFNFFPHFFFPIWKYPNLWQN